jgi:hypothetical protein
MRIQATTAINLTNNEVTIKYPTEPLYTIMEIAEYNIQHLFSLVPKISYMAGFLNY